MSTGTTILPKRKLVHRRPNECRNLILNILQVRVPPWKAQSPNTTQERPKVRTRLLWVTQKPFVHRDTLEPTVLAHVCLGPRVKQRNDTFIIGLEGLVLCVRVGRQVKRMRLFARVHEHTDIPVRCHLIQYKE